MLSKLQIGLVITLVALLAAACQAGTRAEAGDLAQREINVVTTIGMITDVVENVGGERVRTKGLMGPGVDPHLYKASEGDVIRLGSADLVFYSGLHLEAQMGRVLERMAVTGVKTVAVAEPVPQVKPEPKTKVEPKPKAAPKPQPKPKAVVKKATTSAAATETPRSTSTQSDTKHLILSFDGTSWVDVRDANNQRLLYQSMTEGRTVTLEGSPPFRIFLGNAKAVRIRYDGRPIDVAAHQTGLYARFVLGQVQ